MYHNAEALNVIHLDCLQKFVRSTRNLMNRMFEEMEIQLKQGKDADPDRQKGAFEAIS